MSTAISVRVPDELVSKLSEIAQEIERPNSFHVQNANGSRFTQSC